MGEGEFGGEVLEEVVVEEGEALGEGVLGVGVGGIGDDGVDHFDLVGVGEEEEGGRD